MRPKPTHDSAQQKARRTPPIDDTAATEGTLQSVLRRRWAWFAAATVGLVAIAAVVTYLVVTALFEDTSKPLAVAEVVDDFREDEGGTMPAPGLPEVGVYVYATEGGEEVDALGGTRHDYPPETTITVATTECGVQLRWDALEERYEQWELCAAGGTLSLPGYVSFHRFFGQPDLQRYVCDAGSEALPAEVVAGATWQVTCTSASLVETTTYEVLAVADLDAGGEVVEAVHLRTVVELSGGVEGASEGELWLAREGGLPLRWRETTTTVSPSAIGPVRYEESFAIEIVSLAPQR